MAIIEPAHSEEEYLEYRKRMAERSRNYYRSHYLKIDGKYVRHEKGLRPELCQLCRKYPARDYHHWIIGKHTIVGLWVCASCHRLCEGVDKGLDLTYRLLKKRNEQELSSRRFFHKL